MSQGPDQRHRHHDRDQHHQRCAETACQFLLLSNGQRLESSLKDQDLKISEFEEYGTQVGAADLASQDIAPAKARSTFALLTDLTRPNQAELAWRLGLALAAINFVVIAVTVSSVNPRAGRGGNLVFALFAFVVYYNLLNLGETWISAGTANFGNFLLALHGGAFLAGVVWLAKQHNNWSWRLLWRRGMANRSGSP